jgi:hypothetical protein
LGVAPVHRYSLVAFHPRHEPALDISGEILMPKSQCHRIDPS